MLLVGRGVEERADEVRARAQARTQGPQFVNQAGPLPSSAATDSTPSKVAGHVGRQAELLPADATTATCGSLLPPG